MTNYEKIKSMSVEEMAEFMYENCLCACCPYCDGGLCHCDCKDGHKKWLESEVEE